MENLKYKIWAYINRLKRNPKAIYLIWIVFNAVTLFFVNGGFEYKPGFYPFTLSEANVILSEKEIMDIYDLINNPYTSQKDKQFWRDMLKSIIVKRSTYDYSEFIFYLTMPLILFMIYDSLNGEKKNRFINDDENKDYNNGSNKMNAGQPNISVEMAFKILGLTSIASNEEIVNAYKDLIRKYHPDYVSNLGDELKDLANKKSQEINIAYDLLMKNKGR